MILFDISNCREKDSRFDVPCPFSHSQKLDVQVQLLIDEHIHVLNWITVLSLSSKCFLIRNHPEDNYEKIGSNYLVESDSQVTSFSEPFIKRVFKGQSSSSSSIRFWKVVQFCWAIANILLGLLLLLLSSTKLVVISGAHCCTKWDYNILLVCVAILKGIISSTL